jgi:endonuclease/exonuclease/phosphatase family metal-dependent hydrolase
VIDLADGRTLTVINVHGTSGLSESDQRCRVGQLEQVFRDFPDGERNLILGDFNTDPGRNSDFDVSARYMNEHAGPGKRFGFISAVGPDAPGSYTNLFDIDHVLSDVLRGSCVVAGIDAEPAVSAIVYFDHKPQICTVSW